MAGKTKLLKSTLQKFDGNLWYYYVEIPKKLAAPFILGNDRRVVCTLNQTVSFQAALMPLGNGHFFINVNQATRKKLKLNEFDEVLVTLEKDNSEYGLPMPEEFKELLAQDLAGNEVFHQLTPGKQRTLLYIIGKPKSADLRIRNGIAVLEHLKQNDGNIIYKQLNEAIKNRL
jgi:hypothetical protein